MVGVRSFVFSANGGSGCFVTWILVSDTRKDEGRINRELDKLDQWREVLLVGFGYVKYLGRGNEGKLTLWLRSQ